jgi:hypothetical protein
LSLTPIQGSAMTKVMVSSWDPLAAGRNDRPRVELGHEV